MDIPIFQTVCNISPLTAIVTILVLFLGILYYALRDRGLPPGPRGLPFFGYWPFLKDDTAHIHLQQLMKKYGDVYSLTSMGQLYIHLGTIKAIKEAHVTKSDCFSQRYSDFSVLKIVFDKGLISENGESWKVQRKFFLQAFRELGMTSFRDHMTSSIYDSIMSTVDSLKAEGGKPVNIISTLTLRCTTILRRTMFNDDGIAEEELHEIIEAYEKALSILTISKLLLTGKFARRVIFPMSASYKTTVENCKIMVGILKNIVKRHEATFDKDNTRDIIDCYIKERNDRRSKNDPSSEYFTENGLISSLIQFVGDGISGIAILISFFFEALLQHPEEQEKIFKELEDVIGPNRQPTLDDKSQLPYTNAFLQEVLRATDVLNVSPSLECTKDTTLNGYKIPKGAITLMNVWASHRDPNTFNDPEAFKPSRYITEPGKQKSEPPILFGIGKRSCVGESFTMMEVFLFVTTIVKNFRLTRPEGFIEHSARSFLRLNMEICAVPRK